MPGKSQIGNARFCVMLRPGEDNRAAQRRANRTRENVMAQTFVVVHAGPLQIIGCLWALLAFIG